jgi:hypothetical protein
MSKSHALDLVAPKVVSPHGIECQLFVTPTALNRVEEIAPFVFVKFHLRSSRLLLFSLMVERTNPQEMCTGCLHFQAAVTTHRSLRSIGEGNRSAWP